MTGSCQRCGALVTNPPCGLCGSTQIQFDAPRATPSYDPHLSGYGQSASSVTRRPAPGAPQQRRPRITPVLVIAVAVVALAAVAATVSALNRPQTSAPVTNQVTHSITRPADAPSSSTPSMVATSAPPSSVPSPSKSESTTAAITSLPPGSWIMILESLPKGEYSIEQATSRAAALSVPGLSLTVIDSTAIPGLNDGYWAIGLGGLSDRDAAAAKCAAFNREVGGACYPRQVG